MNIGAWEFYRRIIVELDDAGYTPAERALIQTYYREVGLFRWYRRPFFRKHFAESLDRAFAYFSASSAGRPHVLDLGAGLGSQSIYFALNGCRVTAVDMDEDALAILKKRAAYYAKCTGKQFEIQICAGNALTVDYRRLGCFDAVFSMFAFNLMQPSDHLLDAVLPSLQTTARCAVIDGNCTAWLPRLLPARRRAVWAPDEFKRQLVRRGFTVEYHRGGVALPPAVFRVFPYALAAAVDDRLCGSWLLSVSHVILARRFPA